MIKLSDADVAKGAEFALRNLIVDLEETMDGIKQQDEKDAFDKFQYNYCKNLLDSIRDYLREATN